MNAAAGAIELQAVPQQSRFLPRLREAMRARRYSLKTEKAYVHWVRRYIFFHKLRHPKDMGPVEVTAFLNHLANERRVSASTQNQALAALLFVYRHLLQVELPWLDGLVRAKASKRLPTVLTQNEVQAILAKLSGTRWLMVSLMYGAGLRLNECLSLRVKDVDLSGSKLIVRQGKGNKDRVTLLPQRLKLALAAHLKRVRALHQGDLAKGFGEAPLPQALAGRSPRRSLVGLAIRVSVGQPLHRPLHRAHRALAHSREDASASGQGGREAVRHPKASGLPYLSPCLRHPPPGSRSQHSSRSRTVGTQGRGDHHDLHALNEQQPGSRRKPCRCARLTSKPSLTRDNRAV